MNSQASQSIRSWWTVPLPLEPKSLGVDTRPLPKWYCQMRLTITRAVRGFSRLAIHLASSCRRLPTRPSMSTGSELPEMALRNPGCTCSARSLQLPPVST